MIVDLVQPLTRPILSSLSDAITSVFSGFTPRSLFADGSIGVLYDNNDLTTMFLDASGTTPATVNGLVGLQLDKSQGLVLGAERATNGGFTTDLSGWSASPLATWDNGTARLVSGATTGGIFQDITVASGAWVQVTVRAKRNDAGSSGAVIWVVPRGDFAAPNYQRNVTSTSYTDLTWVVKADATTIRVYLQVASGSTADYQVDSVSVKELPGNHRYQATTGFKPVLRGTPTGAELFTAYGTPGAGWSVAGATGTATTASSALPTTTAATVGKFYRVTYTVTRSAGSVQLSFGGRTGVSRSAAGQYVEYFDNALNTNALTATGTGFTGTVRIDEVKDVSAGSVTAPYGLQYDGVDDFLQTASVNFSATDKMFVCAGVRKLLDGSNGTIAELSVASDSNNGSFFLRSSGGGGANYQWNVRSATTNTSPSANVAAPDTSVLTLESNLTSPLTVTRRNAVQQTNLAVPVGGGNFGNYPIYFGRRAGTSLPYNGLDFGFVIVGKTLTAAQISSTERYIAQRTGVSI